MEKIKTVYYKDGITVEDEIGNKMFVYYKMFHNDYRQSRNCLAFALGEMILDENYRSSPKIEFSQETLDESYIK